MSESEEEENYCFHGKPLDPYDEDAIPKKRPISVEEQIATDSHGRRRFHGAFTGGFSAGFFNTVGSLEGWAPSEFKSSRQEKASSVKQRPQDFMDDEDVGEFGFAPETVKATKEFATTSRRKREGYSVTDGPIPGEPVLQTLIGSGNETVGYLLLKNIGLEDKKKMRTKTSTEEKTYGCEMPSSEELGTINSVLEEDSYKIPEIYKLYLEKPKNDTFGIGYSGLDKSHINLFKSTKFVVHDKNKKFSVAGQAFGVGAFEEEDDDIYAKEDMSRYDFEMTREKEVTAGAKKDGVTVLDMFVLSKTSAHNNTRFPPPVIPHSFSGKHKVKRSRFDPIAAEEAVPPRGSINPNIRAKYLGEEINQSSTSSKSIGLGVSGSASKSSNTVKDESDTKHANKSEAVKSFNADLIFDKFVSASQPDDHTNLLETVKPSTLTYGTPEMREAVRMKMFGPLTREVSDWRPCSLLCKRFNIPEPSYDGASNSRNRKRTKHLIFQYQSTVDNEQEYKPGISVMKQDENLLPTNRETETKSKSLNDEAGINLENVSAAEMETSNRLHSSCEPNKSEAVAQDTKSKPSIDTSKEKSRELTDKLGIENNIELFKAVFLSSSESEDDEHQEEPPTRQVTEEMKKNVLSEELIPKIKPVKEGILSNIGHIKFTKPAAPQLDTVDVKEEGSETKKEELLSEDHIYGPKVPQKINPTIKMNRKYEETSSDEDQWVEKGIKEHKKKKKHKKKHKKDKKSHKRNKKDKG